VRKNVVYIFLSIIVFVILVIFSIALFARPLMLRIDTDLDVNSGDIRQRKYICSILIEDNIQTIPFSQEVRRLGLTINKDRRWKHAEGKIRLNHYGRSKYSIAINICNLLIDKFDDYKISDEDRFIILQNAFKYLQAGNIEEIIRLVQTLIVENEKKRNIEKAAY
jgi:hypothetical protein